jgi:hypothetical protein
MKRDFADRGLGSELVERMSTNPEEREPIMSMAYPKDQVETWLVNQNKMNNREITLGLIYYFRDTQDYSHWVGEMVGFIPHLPLLKGSKRMKFKDIFHNLWKAYYEPPYNVNSWHKFLIEDMIEAESKGNSQGQVYLDWDSIIPNPQGVRDFMWNFHKEVSLFLASIPVSEGTAIIRKPQVKEIIERLLV